MDEYVKGHCAIFLSVVLSGYAMEKASNLPRVIVSKSILHYEAMSRDDSSAHYLSVVSGK